MATLFSHDFRSLAGINEIELDGTVDLVSADGFSFIRHTGKTANSWDTNSWWLDTGQVGASGHVVYFRIRTTNPTGLRVLRNTSGSVFGAISANNGVYYRQTNNLNTWNGTVGEVTGISGLASNAWHDIRGTFQADGTIDWDHHAFDGTDFDLISSWTALPSSTVAATWDCVGANIYLASMAHAIGVIEDMDSFFLYG